MNFANIVRPFIFVCIALLSACTQKNTEISSEQKPSTTNQIRIGFQPNEKSSDLDLFKNALSQRLGAEVELLVADDYSNLAMKLKEASVDFAFFSPLNFIEAERSAGAKVLLKRLYGNSEYYYSAIVALKAEAKKGLKGFKLKKIAFVDPKSTSGYLFPLAMLRAAGIKDESYTSVFAGTHEKALGMLGSKEVDAAAVWADPPEEKTGAWIRFPQSVEIGVVQYSEPIPNDAFVVRQSLYDSNPALVLKVMEAMIALSEEPDQVLKKVFDIDSLRPATSRHYDSVRKAAEHLELKK